MRNYETVAKKYGFSLSFLLYVAKYSYFFGIFSIGFDMNALALSSIPHFSVRQGSGYIEK